MAYQILIAISYVNMVCKKIFLLWNKLLEHKTKVSRVLWLLIILFNAIPIFVSQILFFLYKWFHVY